ncbi:fungal trichothecene efflux pump [Ilyonectria sp. MPI-CAGE-AT-0026]|nr:fungal trichothecene efflux pump [Ilyonectria sp. MPI-CAGE-AT-0026]
MHYEDEKHDAGSVHQEEHVGRGEFETHNISLAHTNEGGEPKISLKTWLAIISLAANYISHICAISIIGPIISYINADIGPHASYTWIVSSKTIATGVAGLVAGTVSDLLGRRWLMIGGAMVGVIGGIIGATAQSVPQVIAAMSIIGLSGGASLNSFPCACELVSRKQRGIIMVVVTGSGLPFTAAGSLIGHSMIDTAAGWRTAFCLVTALSVLSTTLGFFFYRPEKALVLQVTTKKQILKDFDYVGLFGISAGPVLLLMAIIWVGSTYEFTDAPVLATFLVGIILIIALGFYEVYVPKNPLLHPFLFKRWRTFTVLLVLTFTSGMLFYCLLTFLSQYFSLGYIGNDPIKVGVYQLPFGFGSFFGGLSVGLTFRYLKHQRLLLLVCVIIQTVFIGLLAVPGPDDLGMACAFTALAGFGIGIEQVIAILLVQLSTPEEWIGFASGTLTGFRLIGGSTGTAVYISIFENEAHKKVPAAIMAAAARYDIPQTSLPALIQGLTSRSGPPVTSVPGVTGEFLVYVTKEMRRAYLNSFHLAWYVAVGLGVFTLAICLLFKDLSSRVDNTVAQRLVNEEITVKRKTEGTTGTV